MTQDATATIASVTSATANRTLPHRQQRPQLEQNVEVDGVGDTQVDRDGDTHTGSPAAPHYVAPSTTTRRPLDCDRERLKAIVEATQNHIQGEKGGFMVRRPYIDPELDRRYWNQLGFLDADTYAQTAGILEVQSIEVAVIVVIDAGGRRRVLTVHGEDEGLLTNTLDDPGKPVMFAGDIFNGESESDDFATHKMFCEALFARQYYCSLVHYQMPTPLPTEKGSIPCVAVTVGLVDQRAVAIVVAIGSVTVTPENCPEVHVIKRNVIKRGRSLRPYEIGPNPVPTIQVSVELKEGKAYATVVASRENLVKAGRNVKLIVQGSPQQRRWDCKSALARIVVLAFLGILGTSLWVPNGHDTPIGLANGVSSGTKGSSGTTEIAGFTNTPGSTDKLVSAENGLSALPAVNNSMPTVDHLENGTLSDTVSSAVQVSKKSGDETSADACSYSTTSSTGSACGSVTSTCTPSSLDAFIESVTKVCPALELVIATDAALETPSSASDKSGHYTSANGLSTSAASSMSTTSGSVPAASASSSLDAFMESVTDVCPLPMPVVATDDVFEQPPSVSNKLGDDTSAIGRSYSAADSTSTTSGIVPAASVSNSWDTFIESVTNTCPSLLPVSALDPARETPLPHQQEPEPWGCVSHGLLFGVRSRRNVQCVLG